MEMLIITYTTKKVGRKKIKTTEIERIPLTHPLARYQLLLTPDCVALEKFKDLKAIFNLKITENEFLESWMNGTALYELAEEITQNADFLGGFTTPLGEKARKRVDFETKAQMVLKYLKAYFRDSVPPVQDFPTDAFLVYCPICDKFVEGSPYLRLSVFPDDEYAYWFVALITHYRHHHISYYDRTLNNMRYGAKNIEFQKLGEDYEEFKRLVNNRAKRQLIRAIKKSNHLPLEHKIGLIRAVFRLRDNDEKTVELAEKTLKKLATTQNERFQ